MKYGVYGVHRFFLWGSELFALKVRVMQSKRCTCALLGNAHIERRHFGAGIVAPTPSHLCKGHEG